MKGCYLLRHYYGVNFIDYTLNSALRHNRQYEEGSANLSPDQYMEILIACRLFANIQ